MAKKRDKAWYNGNPAALVQRIRTLENQLAMDNFIDGACTRIYYGMPMMPAGGVRLDSDTQRFASAFMEALDELSTENLIKPVIDACAAQVVRKPAYRVVTSGSSWKKHRSARKLSRLLTGLYSASGYEAARPSVFRDSARCLVAATKWSIDPDTGKATCDRALPHTIVWDPSQGPRPRDLFQHHGLSRQVLMARYPGHADEIAELPAYRPDPSFIIDQATAYQDQDQVEVFEGWRLPEGKDKGWYAMLVGAIALENKEWKIPRHQLVLLTYGESYSSAAGDPLARQVLTYQFKLNRFNRAIEENATDCAHPQRAIPIGGGVSAEQLANNGSGGTFYYDPASGGRVTWMAGQLLPPQFYQERDSTRDNAYAAGGVSRTAAAGMKPAGIDSGVGIREARDEAAGRQYLTADRLERFDEDNAETALALMRVAYKGKKKRIIAPNTKLLDEIDWDQVGDLKEDEIEVRAFISSAIPNTPAGREETLEEWVQNGVITRKRALRWQANPDLATLEDEDSALEDYCRKLIEAALDDGREMAPEPIIGSDGYAMLLELAGKALLEAITMPEPPPRAHLDLLRRLIKRTQDLVIATTPAAPVPPAAPSAPDAAPPAAPAPA